MSVGNIIVTRLRLTHRVAARLRASLHHWKWAVPLALVAAIVTAAIVHHHVRQDRLAYRLLAAMPDASNNSPLLVKFAVAKARPLFAEHCAACHGADMRGMPALGAPNLTDPVWLYGNGSVYDIERTILYGIRSGHSKAHNVTFMPAFGLTGQLSAAEIRNVVQYLLKINGRPYQVAAANAGREIYFDYKRGNCGDCHGADAKGDYVYGAPDLTVNVWNSGSDPESLYRALYFGEHRMMPAWIDVLDLTQIRALAVYIHAASHPAAESAPGS